MGFIEICIKKCLDIYELVISIFKDRIENFFQ